ncbi:MAG: GDSL-type esterase/lipase family protein [Proteobacteria bacterium]|nr:GDSL-type esterase/lipase family protein [Pseudomonadota bacterium]
MKKWKKFSWIAISAMAMTLGCTAEKAIDFCPNDPDKVVPGVCGCGIPDIIAPETGNIVCEDLCPDDPNKTTPGVCGCGTPDTDSDGDTIPDCLKNIDLCPDDPNKTMPGVCGCGTPDVDANANTIIDCLEEDTEPKGNEGKPGYAAGCKHIVDKNYALTDKTEIVNYLVDACAIGEYYRDDAFMKDSSQEIGDACFCYGQNCSMAGLERPEQLRIIGCDNVPENLNGAVRSCFRSFDMLPIIEPATYFPNGLCTLAMTRCTGAEYICGMTTFGDYSKVDSFTSCPDGNVLAEFNMNIAIGINPDNPHRASLDVRLCLPHCEKDSDCRMNGEFDATIGAQSQVKCIQAENADKTKSAGVCIDQRLVDNSSIGVALIYDGKDDLDMRSFVCFGDSLTFGTGAKPQQSYPKFIESSVWPPVINAGLAGDTAKDAIRRVEHDVLKHDPQAVIVFLGANDIFEQRNVPTANAQLPTLRNDLHNLTMALKAHNRHIFLVNTFGVSDTPAADAQALHLALKRMGLFTDDSEEDFLNMLLVHGKMLEELAQTNELIFIDNVWRGVIDVETNMSPDGIHPNADGYKVMGKNILDQLRLHLNSDLFRD